MGAASVFECGRLARFPLPNCETGQPLTAVADEGVRRVFGTQREKLLVASGRISRQPYAFLCAPQPVPERSDPADLFVATYRGVLGSQSFGELQVSRKTKETKEDRTVSTALRDSSFFAFDFPLRQYNAPHFDFVNDPEERNNQQVTGNLSYFRLQRVWPARSLGIPWWSEPLEIPPHLLAPRTCTATRGAGSGCCNPSSRQPMPPLKTFSCFAVSIGGGTIAVGAWGDDDGGSISGSANVFD